MRGGISDLRAVERWVARVRLGAVAFALFQIGVLPDDFPPGYARAAWATTAVLAVGALALWWVNRREFSESTTRRIGLLSLAFDTAIVSAYVLVYSFEPATPIRQLLFIPLVEAALRYGLAGGVVLPLVVSPVYALFERLNSDRFRGGAFEADNVTFPVGVLIIAGLIVGWLVRRLGKQSEIAEARAAEAERLRDELGRRIDAIEAANRCARALASSLDLERAFAAFIRELAVLIPFDRVAIVLADEGSAEVVATAGKGADGVFPRGTVVPLERSLLRDLLGRRAIYRKDMAEQAYPDEADLVAAGLRSRLAAPLLLGGRSIGMLSVSRAEPHAFTSEDVELVTLLGRLVAAAVQNIRAYEVERETVGELRRLSALRADFVSLVSHELRSPMAAVIGSAQTLAERWRDLSEEQRRALLGLISEETARLANLVDDVLDASRIEAGTFGFSFSNVDVAKLVRESAAAAEAGGGEVRISTSCADGLPAIRGDRERLRQVLANLIDNAVKYSPPGGEVAVSTSLNGEHVRIDVRDDGPGIPSDQQTVIFEKFGRAPAAGPAKPGTGLGLFIARSIAEAHGGTLEVSSAPNEGATFTLALPTQ